MASAKKPKLDLENKLKTLSMRESAEVFRADYGIEGSTEEIMAGINKVLEDQYFYNIEEKPYVREFLELLARNGVKICAATATDRYLVEAALKRRGCSPIFPASLPARRWARARSTRIFSYRPWIFSVRRRRIPWCLRMRTMP